LSTSIGIVFEVRVKYGRADNCSMTPEVVSVIATVTVLVVLVIVFIYYVTK